MAPESSETVSLDAENTRLSSLESLIAPKSIAVVGASADDTKIGGRLLRYLRQFGYQGSIYPVNHNGGAIAGLPVFRNVAEIPCPVDLAILAVPAAATVAAARECELAHVAGIVITSSGLNADEVDALSQIAGCGQMRIVGPNAQGLANFKTGSVANFASLFQSVAPADGPVAIISQSGSISTVAYCALRGRGIGVRYSLATGNEIDVTAGELLGAAVADDEIRLILLYLESVRRPHELARAALAARRRGLPIVAIKAGRSRMGQSAALSHTGALSTEDRIVDAFLEQHGILRVDSLRAFTGCAELYLGQPAPLGRRLMVITDSGATAVLAADASETSGMELPSLGAASAARLEPLMPVYGEIANPLDLTSALSRDATMLSGILDATAQADEFDMTLLAFPSSPPGRDLQIYAQEIASFGVRTGKPVAVAVPQSFNASNFREIGLPVFDDEEEAVAALAQYARHAQLLSRASSKPWKPSAVPAIRPNAVNARFRDEDESLDLMQRLGIPTVARRLCRRMEDVERAFQELGPLVVLKACAADIPHKSDLGLVKLNIATVADAVAAASNLWAKLEALGFAHVPLLLQKLERRPYEFIVGSRMDPVFGTVAIVGAGGILAEQLGDVVVAVAPFESHEIVERLRKTAAAKIWNGARGLQPADLHAVADIAVTLGKFVHSARVVSVDLNPVLVGAVGTTPIVVDALIEQEAGDQSISQSHSPARSA